MSIHTQEFKIVKVEGYGFIAREEGKEPKLIDGQTSIESIAAAFQRQKKETEQIQEEQEENSPQQPQKEESEEKKEETPLKPMRGLGPILDMVNNVEIHKFPYMDLVNLLIREENDKPKERKDLVWELKQALMEKRRYKDSTINSYLSYYLQYIERHHALYKTIKRKNKNQYTYYWIIQKDKPALDTGAAIEMVKGMEIHEEPFKEIHRKYVDKGPVEYVRLMNFFRRYYKVNNKRLKKIEQAYRKYFYEHGYKTYTDAEKETGQVFVTIETRPEQSENN